MTTKKEYLPVLDIEALLPILNKISILGGLSDAQLHTVFRVMESVSYRTGEYVFEQNDPPTHIYVIREGRVRIVVDVEGDPMEIIEFGQGQCFGETSIIAIEPHAASALAMEDTHLIVLSRKALHSLYHTDPELFGMLILNIAREACRRLHRTDEVLLHYARRK